MGAGTRAGGVYVLRCKCVSLHSYYIPSSKKDTATWNARVSLGHLGNQRKQDASFCCSCLAVLTCSLECKLDAHCLYVHDVHKERSGRDVPHSLAAVCHNLKLGDVKLHLNVEY